MYDYTPAPWVIDHSTDKRVGTHIRGGEFLKDVIKPPSICRMTTGMKRREADERLIVAAPELLRDLKGVLELLPICECDSTHRAEGTTCHMCAVYALIEKIEGRKVAQEESAS